jgi:hypothetical protein
MKSKSFTVFVTVCAISLIILIAYQFVPNAKEYAKENHCPYEGYECPNAQAALAEHEECMQAADSIFLVNDSLTNRIQQLETQLAGCDFKDHLQLTNR